MAAFAKGPWLILVEVGPKKQEHFTVTGALFCWALAGVFLLFCPQSELLKPFLYPFYRLNALTHYLTLEDEQSCDREDTGGCKLSPYEIVFFL